MVKEYIIEIEKIKKSDNLNKFHKAIELKIDKSYETVRLMMIEKGKEVKGVRSEWIKDLIEDSKRQFDNKIIVH